MTIPRIVVVGSVNIDMVVKGDRLPRPGRNRDRRPIHHGRRRPKGPTRRWRRQGSGAELHLVAKVGRDVFGDQAIENFPPRNHPHRSHPPRSPERHRRGLILVDRAGENLISVASGANHALTPAEVDRAADCIRAADVLMLQLEIPLGCGAFGRPRSRPPPACP